MANDYSDLDPASPLAGDLVSQGDDKIRETRLKTKNAFCQDLGNTNAEHYNNGPHRFPAGNGSPPGFAGLPPFGHSGRIAIDTTNGRLVRDDGTTWRHLSTVGKYLGYTSGTVSMGNGAMATLITHGAVIIPAGANIVVEFSANFTAGITGVPFYRLQVNGSELNSQPATVVGPSVAAVDTKTIAGMFTWGGALVVGSNSIALRGQGPAGGPGVSGNILFNVYVI